MLFSSKTKVIIDTNIFLLPAKGIDIFHLIHEALQEPYELCTYEGVLLELQKLMEGKKKDSFDAKLGYILIKQKALKILSSSLKTHIDDVIVQKADKKTIIVTQDKELIERLQAQGVRVLRYQQQKLVFQ
jgi:rRNA-processing protein FCF1